MIIKVKDIEELRSAIEDDKIGDDKKAIELAENGDFVDESVKIDRSQQILIKGKEGITIRSENPNNPQTLVGLDIREEAEDIRIENVKLTGWDKDFVAAGLVTNSNDVTFSNVIFEGREDFESNSVFGLRVTNSDNLTVENSQFSNLREGFKATNSSDLEVIGNEFVNLIVDAIDIKNPNGVTVENNIIRDFDPDVTKLDGNHPDAIQFSIYNNAVNKQVSIKNNVALMGDGFGFQGIFIRTYNDGVAHNFDIENNLIQTTAARGITVTKGKNINVVKNTVVFRDAQPVTTVENNQVNKIKIDLGNVENEVVEDNIAGGFVINGERFGGGAKGFAKEPTNGNIATNFKSLGLDFSYEDVFKNGDMLTDPEFYSTISPEDFAVLNSIDAGANLEQLPETMAGAPIEDGLEGTGDPQPPSEPITPESNILISFGNANANNDVLGTAKADVMEADANSSGLRGLGRDGNDTSIGANNVDLAGENGDDLLDLRGGDSFIRGGAGSDTFKVTSETESGSNILDFEQGMDTIVFENVTGISSMSDLTITPLNQSYTADSLINFGEEQIRVKGMMVEDFSNGDFDFL